MQASPEKCSNYWMDELRTRLIRGTIATLPNRIPRYRNGQGACRKLPLGYKAYYYSRPGVRLGGGGGGCGDGPRWKRFLRHLTGRGNASDKHCSTALLLGFLHAEAEICQGICQTGRIMRLPRSTGAAWVPSNPRQRSSAAAICPSFTGSVVRLACIPSLVKAACARSAMKASGFALTASMGKPWPFASSRRFFFAKPPLRPNAEAFSRVKRKRGRGSMLSMVEPSHHHQGRARANKKPGLLRAG